MPTTYKYIKIKDTEIPINIKSYKNSKSIKIFYKGNILTITKPTRISVKMISEILKKNEEDIYNKYKKIITSEISTIKQWQTGEKFYYCGEEFEIERKYTDKNIINIQIDETRKQMIITIPEGISEQEIKVKVDKGMKLLLKKNTEQIICQRLPYWSNITGFDYNQVKIRDAISRYGSCMPSKKNLYFSSRLIMLPLDKIDAIIVHELCHMKYKNHDKLFYALVGKYIQNYKEIDKWLKLYGKRIMF